MILNNEFTVGAELDTVWQRLLDMEGVAGCLPGATVTATDEPNTYDGTMRLKIGPMTVEYHGRATLKEVDEQAHTAVIELRAREAKGQGTATATVKNTVERLNGGTRVRARTDLHITGPQAQFGRGVIEDVGGRVMSEFARRLEAQITAAGAGGAPSGAGTAAAPDGAGARGRPPSGENVLDVAQFFPVRRVGAIAGAVAAVVLALALRWRRRARG